MTGYLRIGDLARRLKCHPQTLLRWERERRITSLRGLGPGAAARYFSRAEVNRLLAWRTPKQVREPIRGSEPKRCH